MQRRIKTLEAPDYGIVGPRAKILRDPTSTPSPFSHPSLEDPSLCSCVNTPLVTRYVNYIFATSTNDLDISFVLIYTIYILSNCNLLNITLFVPVVSLQCMHWPVKEVFYVMFDLVYASKACVVCTQDFNTPCCLLKYMFVRIIVQSTVYPCR